MVYPSEHAARIRAPSGFKRFRRERNVLGERIDGIYGIDDSGNEVVQDIRFDRSAWSATDAQSWLKANGYDPLTFEAASDSGRTDGVQRLVRWDRATINKPIRTPEGFLKADATVTRTGVFTYTNVDGSVRKELRHPDEVLDSESLNSMKMIPVTNGHPPERIVTSDTARYYQIGATGENVRPDGQFIICPVLITDSDAIAEIERGLRQVSLGYEVDLLPEKGTFRGDDYDFRQINIRYNHLAMADSARAGDEAIIHLDSADAVSDGVIHQQIKSRKEEEEMSKINLDGIAYEAAQEVINHVAKLTARADSAESELAGMKKSLETVSGERDAKVDELEKLKKADSAETILEAVKARRELERKADKVLKGDDKIKVDSLSDREIMEAAVKHVHVDADIKDKSDEYVTARFDAVVEAVSVSDNAAADTRRKAGGDTGASHNDGSNDPVNDARQRMIERMSKRDSDK